jgi:dipeptidyl aminopeptidase/acylaminoacyl peptidase
MKPLLAIRYSLFAVLALPLTAGAQQAAQPPASVASGAKQMQPADLKGWTSIRQTVLSNDGKWFAYVVGPNEGEQRVVIRSTAEAGKELSFSIGEPPAAGGGRGGPPDGAGGGSPLVITPDSKWAAFTVYPPRPNRGGAAGRGGRGGAGGSGGAAPAGQQPATGGAGGGTTTFNKMALVNLATGEKKEFEKVRRFAFNGDDPTWVAMQSYPDAPDPNAAAASGGRGGAPAATRSEGTDLVLYKLSSGELVNIGNVSEFGFDDSGDYLAYTIDARDQVGNGVQLRNMKTDVVRAIDSDRALYRRMVWSDSGTALAVLRGKPDSVTRDTLFSVLSFTSFATAGGVPKRVIFDPMGRNDFPAGMKVAGDRAPRYSADLSTIFIGIREVRKPRPGDRMLAGRGAGNSVIQAGAPGAGGTVNQPRLGNGESEDENPSLVLWHAKDPRLQSQQIVQEQADRAFSYSAEYRIADNKFIRLSDDALRTVTPTPKDRYAYGTDTREYDQPASYSGRRYIDLYAVDLKTGERKLLMKKHPAGLQVASPDGRQLLYWGDNAQYWVLDLVTGDKRDITSGVPTMFADTSDDHNNLVTPPRFPVGWAKDAASVLLSDGFDVWKVPVKAGAGPAVNLTVNGAKDQIRYQRLYNFETTPVGGRGGRGGGGGGRGGATAQDGIDLSKPLYFATYGEWTKKEGLAKVMPGKPGAQTLVTADARLNFQKAKEADVYLYTRQTAIDYPNYYVASADLSSGRQITDINPQQKEFAWSSGVKLINYTSDKGDKLQGALYLPANYEPGKKYPLLVTIYEKRSNLLHTYVGPNETSTPNRSIYTSRGYAVLDPDIVYRVNDPGMSAVWCVIPAVKAAIATGLVDSTNIGLWGHSWGGYQTAFLVTQTNLFKSAIAGAALTDMVSMYSSVYWNTGGTNQAIFESSQGRFKGNFIDNYEAYIRNSPVFHAKNVQTPLILLHNDKDGAVDFNQGITYFNTLRQLGKNVILLEYVGENHGLARPVNQKDYAVRQREWFDHYLKGAPAPDWMTKGVPRIQMDDHFADRKAAAQTIVP